MEHIVRVEDTIGILANCLVLAPILERRREVFGLKSGKITRVTLFARGVRSHQMHEFKEFVLGKRGRFTRQQMGQDIPIQFQILSPPIARRSHISVVQTIRSGGNCCHRLDKQALLLLVAQPVGIVAGFLQNERQGRRSIPRRERIRPLEKGEHLGQRSRRIGSRSHRIIEQNHLFACN